MWSSCSSLGSFDVDLVASLRDRYLAGRIIFHALHISVIPLAKKWGLQVLEKKERNYVRIL